MKFKEINLFANKHDILMFVVSFIASSLVSIYLYKNYIKVHYEKNETPEYALSFYSTQGHPIGESEDGLRLILDPYLLYKNYPNQLTSKYSIDSNGFRGGYKKPDIAANGFVVGGSAAFGLGISGDDFTFTSRLSKINSKYNFINAGVASIGSGQELSLIVHYLDTFKPNIYVVFNGWNDVFIPSVYLKYFPARKKLPLGYNNVFFDIENRLEKYNLALRTKKPKIIPEELGIPISAEHCVKELQKTYLENISKMHDFTQSRGAKFLAVLQPELSMKKYKSKFEQEVIKDWDKKFNYSNMKISQRYLDLRTSAKIFFKENNILFVDINDEPDFVDNKKTLFFDVVHANEHGNKIIAEILNKYLVNSY